MHGGAASSVVLIGQTTKHWRAATSVVPQSEHLTLCPVYALLQMVLGSDWTPVRAFSVVRCRLHIV